MREQQTEQDAGSGRLVVEAIENGTPWSCVRMGDAEVVYLFSEAMRHRMGQHRTVPQAYSLEFETAMVKTYQTADVIGLWPPTGKHSVTDPNLHKKLWDELPFRAMSLDILARHCIVPLALASWICVTTWVKSHGLLAALAGKRVALLGLSAHALAALWQAPGWLKYYAKFGASPETEIVAAILTPEAHSYDYVDVAWGELCRAEYDVLLAGSGTAGKVLCGRAKAEGKIGIDCGFILEALAGVCNPKRPLVNYEFDYRHPVFHPTPTAMSVRLAKARREYYEMEI